MGKIFRPSNREAQILSKIESSKEYARRKAIAGIRDCIEPLANSIAMKLVEDKIVETTNKNGIEEQILKCLERLGRAENFDIDYFIAPYRQVAPQPHVVSLYLTAFVIEQLINNKDVIDIFGSNEDIYLTINKQVREYLP